MILPKQGIPSECSELFFGGELLMVSGLPMIKWGADGKDMFYGANEEVIDMPFVPTTVTTAIINSWATRGLDERFFGEYIVVVGTNPETGDEYQFGARQELNFSLRLAGVFREDDTIPL